MNRPLDGATAEVATPFVGCALQSIQHDTPADVRAGMVVALLATAQLVPTRTRVPVNEFVAVLAFVDRILAELPDATDTTRARLIEFRDQLSSLSRRPRPFREANQTATWVLDQSIVERERAHGTPGHRFLPTEPAA